MLCVSAMKGLRVSDDLKLRVECENVCVPDSGLDTVAVGYANACARLTGSGDVKRFAVMRMAVLTRMITTMMRHYLGSTFTHYLTLLGVDWKQRDEKN